MSDFTRNLRGWAHITNQIGNMQDMHRQRKREQEYESALNTLQSGGELSAAGLGAMQAQRDWTRHQTGQMQYQELQDGREAKKNFKRWQNDVFLPSLKKGPKNMDAPSLYNSASDYNVPIDLVDDAVLDVASTIKNTEGLNKILEMQKLANSEQTYRQFQNGLNQIEGIADKGQRMQATQRLLKEMPVEYDLQVNTDGTFNILDDFAEDVNDPKVLYENVSEEEVLNILRQSDFPQFAAVVEDWRQRKSEFNKEALRKRFPAKDSQGNEYFFRVLKGERPGQMNYQLFDSRNNKLLGEFSGLEEIRSLGGLNIMPEDIDYVKDQLDIRERKADINKTRADTTDRRVQTQGRLREQEGAARGAESPKPMDSQRLASVVDPVLDEFSLGINMTPQDKLNIRAEISRMHQEGMEIHQALEQVLMRRIENMPDMPPEEKKDLRDRFHSWIWSGWLWSGAKRAGKHAFTALQGPPYGQVAAGLGLESDIDQEQSGSKIRRPIQESAQAPPPDMPANARRAPDGKWYILDPDRPGKYLEVRP